MTTILRQLAQSAEEHEEALMGFRQIYLHGECYAFAIGLHQGLGWPLVGLIKDYDEASQKHGLIWHAGVCGPDGRLYDIRGGVSQEEFCEPYELPSYNIRNITKEHLFATEKGVDERAIKLARQIAEALWPELPWKDTVAARAKAFADDLEAISRKHGFWINGSVPADPPRLYLEGDDEGGYEVRQTAYGFLYTINRYLNLELQMHEAEQRFSLPLKAT